MKFFVFAVLALSLSSSISTTNAFSASYLDQLSVKNVESAPSTIPKTTPQEQPSGAKGGDVASKLVGGFPASSSLVDAGFDGSNVITEADREVMEDPIFVKEMKMYAESPFTTPEMIMIAKRFLHMNQGIDSPELLATDFRFMGPVVGGDDGLTKDEFLKAVGGFDIKSAFPDINPGFHHFRVDPFAPDRVFFTSTATGTHLGNFLGIEPTGKSFNTPPQACSVTIDSSGLITKYTIGHVMDRSIGNTGGLGGIFGPLVAIGKPFPFPEARPYKPSKRYRAFQLLGKGITKLNKWKEERKERKAMEAA